jgi:hypothetical protein
MDGEFTVTAPMLVRLCDVVLDGELGAEALHSIGFALMASDTFAGTLTRTKYLQIIADWSCPEVHYPLTIENVKTGSA